MCEGFQDAGKLVIKPKELEGLNILSQSDVNLELAWLDLCCRAEELLTPLPRDSFLAPIQRLAHTLVHHLLNLLLILLFLLCRKCRRVNETSSQHLIPSSRIRCPFVSAYEWAPHEYNDSSPATWVVIFVRYTTIVEQW